MDDAPRLAPLAQPAGPSRYRAGHARLGVRRLPRAAMRALAALAFGACALSATAVPAMMPSSPASAALTPPSPASAALAQPAPAQRVTVPGEPGMPTLTAYWFLPRESSTARATGMPVVVALHGCNGLDEPRKTGVLQTRYREYAHWLNERGYAVLMPDSYGPRGKESSCNEAPDARTLDDKTRRADALAALRWLADQSGIDMRRVVLLGWSNGAQAVLATIDASRPWPAATPNVERAVAFYPGCRRAVQQHNFRLRSPLLVMIGGADDWTPATRCAMLQSAVQARQPNARFRLEIYPGAYHGFDGTSELHVRRDVASTRRGGHVTVGGDAVARVAALTQLDSWLSSTEP